MPRGALSPAAAHEPGLNRSDSHQRANPESRTESLLPVSRHTHNKPIASAPLTPIASFSSEDLSRMRRQSPDAYQALMQYEQLLRRVTAQVEAKDIELQRCIDVGQEVLGRLDEMQSRCTQLALERDEVMRRARREALKAQKRITQLESEHSLAKEKAQSSVLVAPQGYVTQEPDRSITHEEPSPELRTCATQSAALYDQLIDILQQMELLCTHSNDTHKNGYTGTVNAFTPFSSHSSSATQMRVPPLSSLKNTAHSILSWLTGTLGAMTRLASSLAILTQQFDTQRERNDTARQTIESERNRACSEAREARGECNALRNALATLRAEVAAIDAETNRMQSCENDALQDLEARVAEGDAAVAKLTRQLREAHIESAALQDAAHRAAKNSKEVSAQVERFEELETELMRARECVQGKETAREVLESQLMRVRRCIPNTQRIKHMVERMAQAAANQIEKGHAIVNSQLKEPQRQVKPSSTARKSLRGAAAEKKGVDEYEEYEEEEDELEYNEREVDTANAKAAAVAVSRFVCDWAAAVEQMFLSPILTALESAQPAAAPAETGASPSASRVTPLEKEKATAGLVWTVSEREETWAVAADGVVHAFAVALATILQRMHNSHAVGSSHTTESPDLEEENSVRCIALCARISELEECLASRTQTQSAEREQWRDAVTLLQTERAEARRPLRAARERLATLREAWRVQQERIEVESRETQALREVNHALERRIAEVEREREPLRQQLQCLLLGKPWCEEDTPA